MNTFMSSSVRLIVVGSNRSIAHFICPLQRWQFKEIRFPGLFDVKWWWRKNSFFEPIMAYNSEISFEFSNMHALHSIFILDKLYIWWKQPLFLCPSFLWTSRILLFSRQIPTISMILLVFFPPPSTTSLRSIVFSRTFFRRFEELNLERTVGPFVCFSPSLQDDWLNHNHCFFFFWRKICLIPAIFSLFSIVRFLYNTTIIFLLQTYLDIYNSSPQLSYELKYYCVCTHSPHVFLALATTHFEISSAFFFVSRDFFTLLTILDYRQLKISWHVLLLQLALAAAGCYRLSYLTLGYGLLSLIVSLFISPQKYPVKSVYICSAICMLYSLAVIILYILSSTMETVFPLCTRWNRLFSIGPGIHGIQETDDCGGLRPIHYLWCDCLYPLHRRYDRGKVQEGTSSSLLPSNCLVDQLHHHSSWLHQFPLPHSSSLFPLWPLPSQPCPCLLLGHDLWILDAYTHQCQVLYEERNHEYHQLLTSSLHCHLVCSPSPSSPL